MNINSDGISILQNVYIKNNTTNYPLNIDYNDTNICKLTNDGKVTLSSGIQVNGIDGLELYSGVNKKVHITNDSKISLKGIYNSNSKI